MEGGSNHAERLAPSVGGLRSEDELRVIEQWLERPGTLASEALLDLLDPGLERSHVLLQLCEVALEDLAPAALVGKSHLDPAQGLCDCLVLLLESLESAVDLIEVPEHLLSQLGEAEVYLVEPAVHVAEPAVDPGELTSQEFDELLVLDGGHGPYLSQVQALFKCAQRWTGEPGDSWSPWRGSGRWARVGGMPALEAREPRSFQAP
jgi:hypothetical protein